MYISIYYKTCKRKMNIENNYSCLRKDVNIWFIFLLQSVSRFTRYSFFKDITSSLLIRHTVSPLGLVNVGFIPNFKKTIFLLGNLCLCLMVDTAEYLINQLTIFLI